MVIAIRLSPQADKSLVIPLQGGGDGGPLPLPVSLGGLAFAGLMRNRYGAMNTDLVSAIAPSPAPRPQYAVAANATFTALDTPTGWLTQGDVVIDTVIDPTSTGSGQGYSNLATVSLAITAVNDAPVAADAALTTAEDAALADDARWMTSSQVVVITSIMRGKKSSN